MKKRARIILLAVGVYAILLLLLLAAESGDPDASIHTFGDAVWYSLITMTTVGYGDLSPVTPAGRFLGLLFALCSIGILTALIGIGLQLLGGQLIPNARLRLGRKRPWHIFLQGGEDATAMAEALRRTDPGGLLLFPGEGGGSPTGPDVIHIDADLARLLRLRGSPEGADCFVLGDDPWKNYALGRGAADSGIPVYCMTEITAQDSPVGLRCFRRWEALARCYWKEHPLARDERTVVLIGCGTAGSAILERALLTNVFAADRPIAYHVFGDTARFRSLHPRIAAALAGHTPGEDALVFHAGEWTDCADLLRGADRIILCADEDRENLAAYDTLCAWFPVTGRIHLRLSEPVTPLTSFGDRKSIITPEYVMLDTINRLAAALNDIYNRGAPCPTAWEDLNWFLRQSNIAAADHLPVKIRLLLDDDGITEVTPELCRRAYDRYAAVAGTNADFFREIEHRRWMRFYQMYNWEYAPERDNPQRRHPMLIPYDALPPGEKEKDAYAWEILKELIPKA